MDKLTPRENDVLRAISTQDKPRPEIAISLGMRYGTMKNHIAAIKLKLGVLTTSYAVALYAANHPKDVLSKGRPQS